MIRWWDRAACRGMDIAIFFAEGEMATREALAVCAGCPVRGECLADALELGDDAGVRGGLTARERRLLRIPAHEHSVAAYKVWRRRGLTCDGCLTAMNEARREMRAARTPEQRARDAARQAEYRWQRRRKGRVA